MLDKGVLHTLAGTEQDNERWHHAIQNGTSLTTHPSFISGIYYLLFSDHGWPQVIATAESETLDKEGLP